MTDFDWHPELPAVITCAKCGERMIRGPFCSDLAAIVLHWMSDHTVEYGDMHPESAPYMPGHPAYEG